VPSLLVLVCELRGSILTVSNAAPQVDDTVDPSSPAMDPSSPDAVSASARARQFVAKGATVLKGFDYAALANALAEIQLGQGPSPFAAGLRQKSVEADKDVTLESQAGKKTIQDILKDSNLTIGIEMEFTCDGRHAEGLFKITAVCDGTPITSRSKRCVQEGRFRNHLIHGDSLGQLLNGDGIIHFPGWEHLHGQHELRGLNILSSHLGRRLLLRSHALGSVGSMQSDDVGCSSFGSPPSFMMNSKTDPGKLVIMALQQLLPHLLAFGAKPSTPESIRLQTYLTTNRGFRIRQSSSGRMSQQNRASQIAVRNTTELDRLALSLDQILEDRVQEPLTT
jgi:hypothetical protein